tara:strand:- start:2537 stop:3193 length:657 start_codon:yes stop_codon:yes gene_type:complete
LEGHALYKHKDFKKLKELMPQLTSIRINTQFQPRTNPPSQGPQMVGDHRGRPQRMLRLPTGIEISLIYRFLQTADVLWLLQNFRGVAHSIVHFANDSDARSIEYIEYRRRKIVLISTVVPEREQASLEGIRRGIKLEVREIGARVADYFRLPSIQGLNNFVLPDPDIAEYALTLKNNNTTVAWAIRGLQGQWSAYKRLPGYAEKMRSIYRRRLHSTQA